MQQRDPYVPQTPGANTGPAESRYLSLEEFRRPYLERARECSELTIPHLVPPEGWTGHSKLYTPYQSLGSRGVNNLASKFILILFPPNSPFFRYRIAEAVIEKLSKDEDRKTKIEQGLAKREREITSEIESTAMRVPAFEAIKHLVVAGNILCYLPPQGGLKAFHLDRYVVRRDPMGNVLEIVTKEDIAPSVLPQEIQEAVSLKSEGKDYKTCSLFTHVQREDDNTFSVYQEVKGIRIPGSEGSYPADALPWLPLRFHAIDGEDYGRGLVEDYLGDLKSLESLAKSIVEGSAAAAKLLILVNPNGTTRLKDVAEADNGAVRAGNAADVTTVQMQKFNDFQVAANTAQEISQRLSFAFLMNTAIQRKGERVTAEEIRYMAGELEDALGGIYSILSLEFQLPVVKITEKRMEKQKKLAKLPKGMVRPVITTGLEALGRGHDLAKLDSFVSVPDSVAPAFMGVINLMDYAKRRATGLGVDPEGLIKTEQQIAQEQQQAQQQAMIDKLGPNAVNQLGALTKEGIARSAPQPTPQQ